MIVEFIGCTGAGKSTLIPQVQRQIAQVAETSAAYTQIVSRRGLQRIQHPSARNLIQEFVTLPHFIRAAPRHQEFIGLNLRIIAGQAREPFFAFNNLRSLERKLGIYEVIRRRDKIILVDEGTVLQAHHLFVFTGDRLNASELARFARLLPLPDAIVYIRAPVDDLVQRSISRPDPPRIMKKKSLEQNERAIRRAVALFDALVQTERIRPRAMIVDNPDSMKHEQVSLVRQIAEFILCHPARTANSSMTGSMSGEP